MTTKALFVLLAAFLVNSISYAQTTHNDSLLKNKQVQYLAPRLNDRTVTMKILYGDVNGDGVEDAFVDWCIQATDKDRDAGGGNALMFLQCMEHGFSVYIKKENEYVLAADKGKDSFTDEGFSYDADKIEKEKSFARTFPMQRMIPVAALL